MEWQVAGACNYDCSYCIQSKANRVGHPTDAMVDGFLRFFAALPPRGARPWEIKMSGGEPFAFRGFMDRVVPGLIAETPHVLSVLTNLSAPLSVLERFAELTRGRLGVVSASVHLEHVDAEAFAEKARRFREALGPGPRLVINAVLVPGRLPQVARAKGAIHAAGLPFFPQVMKTKSGVFAYDDEDAPRVSDLLGPSPSPRTANTAPSYRGRLCFTGVDYFVLAQDGDAWSCRTARRNGAGYLGNVLGGTFALLSAPRACAWDICPCTVPANRGMIEGIEP